MLKKPTLVLLLLFTCAIGICQNKPNNIATPKYEFPLIFQLPNDEWHIAVNKPPGEYIFKRNGVTDSKGNLVIPAIMMYAEDATGYKQDVALFASKKMQPFTDQGVKPQHFLTYKDVGYPLNFKNGIYIKGIYTANNIDHVIYMIYLIDKHNKGIQVYMDMTTEVAKEYEPEFWVTIKSLKEVEWSGRIMEFKNWS